MESLEHTIRNLLSGKKEQSIEIDIVELFQMVQEEYFNNFLTEETYEEYDEDLFVECYFECLNELLNEGDAARKIPVTPTSANDNKPRTAANDNKPRTAANDNKPPQTQRLKNAAPKTTSVTPKLQMPKGVPDSTQRLKISQQAVEKIVGKAANQNVKQKLALKIAGKIGTAVAKRVGMGAAIGAAAGAFTGPFAPVVVPVISGAGALAGLGLAAYDAYDIYKDVVGKSPVEIPKTAPAPVAPKREKAPAPEKAPEPETAPEPEKAPAPVAPKREKAPAPATAPSTAPATAPAPVVPVAPPVQAKKPSTETNKRTQPSPKSKKEPSSERTRRRLALSGALGNLTSGGSGPGSISQPGSMTQLHIASPSSGISPTIRESESPATKARKTIENVARPKLKNLRNALGNKQGEIEKKIKE